MRRAVGQLGLRGRRPPSPDPQPPSPRRLGPDAQASARTLASPSSWERSRPPTTSPGIIGSPSRVAPDSTVATVSWQSPSRAAPVDPDESVLPGPSARTSERASPRGALPAITRFAPIACRFSKTRQPAAVATPAAVHRQRVFAGFARSAASSSCIDAGRALNPSPVQRPRPCEPTMGPFSPSTVSGPRREAWNTPSARTCPPRRGAPRRALGTTSRRMQNAGAPRQSRRRSCTAPAPCSQGSP